MPRLSGAVHETNQLEVEHLVGGGCGRLRWLEPILERGRRILCTQDHKHRVIAFLLEGRRIASIGVNSYEKTHPTQAHFARLTGNPKREYIHAEIAAMSTRSGLRAISGSSSLRILVARLDRRGRFVLAKPCSACMAAIAQHQIGKVYHT